MLVVLPFLYEPSQARAEPEPAEQIADLALEIIDLVLEHHVDPPARQQMLLDGVRALYQRTDRPLPAGLSRRVSALAGKEQERALLIEAWNALGDSQLGARDREAVLLGGLSATVRGEMRFIPAKEFDVEEQLRGNRYVGIGVGLGIGKDGGLPFFATVFPQGSAYKAGIRAEDQILQIDGVAMEGKRLEEVVDRIRGPEGSTVSLLIQRPGTEEPLSFSLRRSVVPFQTVLGYSKMEDGTWDYRADSGIAYVQITEVRASTLHELRQAEQRLRSAGYNKLILDLRANDGRNFHDTLLLADSLLPETVIGSVRRSRGQEVFKSTPDCLFRDWPLAVLIDPNTRGAAEWLAAALQDGRGAMLLGSPTGGTGFIVEPVKLPSGHGAVQLWSGVLHRADGRSLFCANPDVFKRDVASYLAAKLDTPSQARPNNPNDAGLAPDVEVAFRENLPAGATSYRSRIRLEGRPPADPQFNRAVEELSRKPRPVGEKP
jgi:carboxyl-terminal processing protease